MASKVLRLEWVYPEDLVPGSPVGVSFAWFPHSDLERSPCLRWQDGDPPPSPPSDALLGRWAPSPCWVGGKPAVNVKILKGAVGLFDDGPFVHLYVNGSEYAVAKGTPALTFPLPDTMEVPEWEK